MLESPKVDLSYVWPRHVFLDGSPAVPFGISNPPEWPGREGLVQGNFIYISGVVHYPMCILEKAFDEELNSIEDYDYWMRLATLGFRFAKNTNTCFTYTVKDNGMGSKSNDEIWARFRQKHPK